MSSATPARSAAYRATFSDAGSASVAWIRSSSAGNSCSRACRLAVLQMSDSIAGHSSETKRRLSPGAMRRPIIAASIASVPAPQNGSSIGRPLRQ